MRSSCWVTRVGPKLSDECPDKREEGTQRRRRVKGTQRARQCGHSPGMPGPTRGWKRQEGSCLQDDLDLGLPASRTFREWIPVQ